MKTGFYNKYYKLGLEYFINKKFFGLHKPNAYTELFYLALIAFIIVIANLI